MTKGPDPSLEANSLWDLAEANLSAADFAIAVRKAYDVTTDAGAEPADVRAYILFQLSLMQHRKLITKKHCTLVDKLIPKPPRKKKGRPKGALGNKAYNKRYALYVDWVDQKALNPRMTREQFAKGRLGITDADLAGDYEVEHRAKIDALLQDLKPARMNQLDQGQRRAIETIKPLLVTHSMSLAQKWREAKERSPKLTKEDFLQYEVFKWPRGSKRHPNETDMIEEYLKQLHEAEKLLDRSERG